MAEGKRGAPVGNKNGVNKGLLSAKLRKRLEERDSIRKMMDALVSKAEEGDLAAIKEVFDRIDGKAKQQIEQTNTNIEITHEQWLAQLED